MHVLPSPFPLTSVCTLRISFFFSSPTNMKRFPVSLKLLRMTHCRKRACVRIYQCSPFTCSSRALQRIGSLASPRLSPATNIQELIKQKNNRLGFQKLRPSVCGRAVDRRTHPRSACHRELVRLRHNNIFIIRARTAGALEPHGPDWAPGELKANITWATPLNVQHTPCAWQLKSTWNALRSEFYFCNVGQQLVLFKQESIRLWKGWHSILDWC